MVSLYRDDIQQLRQTTDSSEREKKGFGTEREIK